MENIIAPAVTTKIKGFIYKIYNKNDATMFYIGSSTTSLNIRTDQHKQKAKKRTSKLYKYIRDNGGIENFISEVIEKIEVENINELRTKEQDMINLLKPTLNSNVASTNIIIDQRIDKNLYNKLYRHTKKHKEYIKTLSQTDEYKDYIKKKRLSEDYKIYQKKYQTIYRQSKKKIKIN
jgi:hypothetical protein